MSSGSLSVLSRQVRHHDAKYLGAEAFDQLRSEWQCSWQAYATHVGASRRARR